MAFIEQIVPIIRKYVKEYGFGVVSAITAQAVLESANGTSELAVNAHNYFGLKHTKGRCPTAVAVYAKDGSEQLPDGSYATGAMLWEKFPSMEAGVQGYFDFLSNGYGRYDNLVEIYGPQMYLEVIKEDGYATSLDYVKKVWAVLLKYDLRQYDEVQRMATRTYSPLCNEVVAFGAKNSNPRKNQITKITIHHMAGVMDAGNCARMHLRSSGSSANYYIGNDGKICGGVDETKRAWTSGTGDGKNTNDHMAITIEVSNSKHGNVDARWPVSDAAYKSMIALCADICKFYDITPHFDGTLNGTLTCHYMTQATACPGPYLKQLHQSGQIERDILAAMGAVTPVPTPTEPVLLRVQTGAYRDKQNAFNRLAELRKKGVDGIVVLADDGLYKVQVGAFSVEANAHNKALELQQKGFTTFVTDKGGTMIAENETKTHTVRSGDSLSVIAKLHSTTVEQLQAANGIKDKNLIYPGQKLVVP